MKIAIAENLVKAAEGFFDKNDPDLQHSFADMKEHAERKDPEYVPNSNRPELLDNTPISVQELNEQTRPDGHPYSYMGFVEVPDDEA